MIKPRTVITLFLIGILLAGCGSDPPQEEVLRPVRYMEVFESGATRVRSFSGIAEAGVESNLSFKVGGTLESVAVEVGSRVRRGSLIARLDQRDYELAVQEAEAGLRQARSEAQAAANEYERVKRLWENENASKSQLDQARAAAESSEAAVSTVEKRLEQAQLQLSYTRLTAPRDGQIASVPVEVNENVKAGQLVAVLTAGTRPKVTVTVPEQLIAKIDAGKQVKVIFDAIPGEEFAATITEVGVTSADIGTTFPVTALLDESAPEVRPGMAAQVAITFGEGEGISRIVLPSAAVAEDHEGRYVLLLEPGENETGRVRRQAVEVGALTEEGLELLSGVEEGDLVVTAGVSRIVDGQEVRVPSEGQGGR